VARRVDGLLLARGEHRAAAGGTGASVTLICPLCGSSFLILTARCCGRMAQAAPR
jgi:hypothetical protein